MAGGAEREDGGTVDLWRRVPEHMSTAVVVLDPALEVIALNPAAEALLETSVRQSLGLPLARVVRGDDCVQLAARATVSGRSCVERNLRLGERMVDCAATPLGGEGGAPEDAGGGVILEMANVERYQRMSHEGRLLTRNESVKAVVRGLAHEIRNPLGGLRGAAQLLERELEAAARGRGAAVLAEVRELTQYTGIIISEADRLGLLVDRLLLPEAPAAPPEPVNVHRVTERVCALLEAEAAPRRVAIVRDYDPSIPSLIGSFDHLVQAVLNVARNAVQAQGGRILIRTRVVRQAHVGARQHALAARVDVIDNGAGVPPDIAESLFYPMVSGRADGTGLGLSIAQAIVSRHGGIIGHVREDDETVFSLLLPITPAAPPPAPPSPAAPGTPVTDGRAQPE